MLFRSKDSVIDPAVGICLVKKRGARIRKGDVIAEVHASESKKGAAAVRLVGSAYRIGPEPVEPVPVVKAVIDGVLSDDRYAKTSDWNRKF